MMTLAERVTRDKGGHWHGTYGEIPATGAPATDRSLVVRDSRDGGLFVWSKTGGDGKAERKQICRERFRAKRRAATTGGDA
jgi:hypothetical protein